MASFVDKVARIPCGNCNASVDTAAAQPLSQIDCPSCGSALTVPGAVGKLLLKKVIGKGAAGIVYQAYDQENQRNVALKVFLKENTLEGDGRDAGHVEKCLAEARAMHALDHPNVVRIYSVAQKADRPFIVMELLEGDRLDTLIEQKWLVQEPRALQMAIDVASGLQAGHEAGIAHLDVKPANIQMDAAGNCKLLDFDTALSHEQIESQGTGLVGTPYYVAPEIIRRDKVDFRADMFSLGATLFHLIAQRPPFQGETSKEVIQNRLKHRALTLIDVRSDVSPQTSYVIARMLEPDPELRYPDYESLLADLQQAVVAANCRVQAAQVEALEQAPVKTNTSLVVSAFVLTVILIAAGLFFLQGADTNSDNGNGNQKADSNNLHASAQDRDKENRHDKSVTKPGVPDGKDSDRGNHIVIPDVPDTHIVPVSPIKQTDKSGNPNHSVSPKDGNQTNTHNGQSGTKDKGVITGIPPAKPPANVEPVQVADAEGWRGGKNVSLLLQPGQLTIGSLGRQATLIHADLPGASAANPGEPMYLVFRLKASEQGAGLLWWSTQSEPGFVKERSQSFRIVHDDQWHTYVIPLFVSSPQFQLRLDLGQGAGFYQLQWIRLFHNGDTSQPAAKEWLFGK
jgi:serine/threonine protein kinase